MVIETTFQNMDIKKHTCQIAVLAINALVLVLVVFGIKDYEMKKIPLENTTDENVVPVDSSIIAIQNEITQDREDKLRKLNTGPKSILQKNTTITSTVTTPVATKAPDKKTKTS